MTNDLYLIVSYFGFAALSIFCAVTVYLLLRRLFNSTVDTAPRVQLRPLLKRIFPLGLLLPALLGFLSVSYQSCNRTTYDKIVQSRSYLVQKNKEQMSASFLSLLAAILFWNFVLVAVLKYSQKEMKQSSKT